jgi:glucose-1-phosphate cytidylyltransferase
MTGFRTKMAGKYVDGDRFMLTYGDALSDVNLEKLLEFNKQQDTIGTVTGVYPASRFGDLVTDGNQVTRFKEKLKDLEHQNPINDGYFVFKKEFLDLIPDDPSIDMEKAPMDDLVEKNQLSVFRHDGYCHCMDTYRDYIHLNNMWEKEPVWKIW